MNITTRTTIVSNVQLDDNIRIWLLEEEGFKSAPENWKCRRRNNVFRQSIPDPRSRNVEDSRNINTTGRLELAQRSARWPCRSATRSSGPRYHGAVSCGTLYVSTAILYWMRSGTRSQCRPTKAPVMWSRRLRWKISRLQTAQRTDWDTD